MTTTDAERQVALTPRQLQTVELIALGCSNDEIGTRLGITPRTAKAHSDAIREKLGVPKRRQIPAAFRALTGIDPVAVAFARVHEPAPALPGIGS